MPYLFKSEAYAFLVSGDLKLYAVNKIENLSQKSRFQIDYARAFKFPSTLSKQTYCKQLDYAASSFDFSLGSRFYLGLWES